MTDREFDEARDCYESYYAAVAELRRRFLEMRRVPELRDPGAGGVLDRRRSEHDCGSSSGGCS